VFDRARRRLTLQAVVLFAVVLLVFSIVFYLVLSVVLRPAFDIAPELPDDDSARAAYARTIEFIGVALLVANAVAIGIALVAGHVLAGRTLRPIRAALERQRRFVADASHEMRAPLTIIRTSVDDALRLPLDPEQALEALQTVSTATDRLTAMTADLLLLARSEDGAQVPTASPIDLSVSVAEACREVRGARHASIELLLAPDLVVLADDEMLQRVAANLIDNGWRYSGGKPVVVRTSGTDRLAILEVQDRGPGIGAADLERIFEPFHRVHADRDAPAGTGLGLAIALSITRSFGGRITVDSRPGGGSTFRVELPRVR